MTDFNATYAQPEPSKPKRRKTPWIIGGIAALVLLVCGGGGIAFLGSLGSEIDKATPKVQASAPATASDTASAEPAAEEPDSKEATAKVGQSLNQSGDTEAIWTIDKTARKTVAEFDQRPEKGVFLLAHVKVKVTSGSQFVCGCNFQLVTKAGKVYEVSFNGFKGYEEITGNEIAAGQNTDGWIAFDVPKAALAGAKIKLGLDTYSGVYAYWTL